METPVNDKIIKQKMINEVRYDLIYYFRNGYINPKFFFEFEDVKFGSLKEILSIHFIISQNVFNYITTLNSSIHQLRHSTEPKIEIFRGEIRGRIKWNETIQERYKTGNVSKITFACANSSKLYNTKENIVLKKSLEILNKIIFEDVGMERFQKYEWFKNGKNIMDTVETLLNRNIYIKRIDTSKIKISDKMLNDVLKSRKKIYRDAALIIKFYNLVMSENIDIINTLLQTTFIEMQDIDEVFELYSIIKYIRSKFMNIRFNIIDGSEDYLAEAILENGNKVLIYHNRSAPKYLNFQVRLIDIIGSHKYLQQLRNITKLTNDFKLLQGSKSNDIIWSGRPDLIILEFEEEILSNITIGEIKYTRDIEYAYTGFNELAEYMEFMEVKDLDLECELPSVKGLLFVEEVNFREYSIDNITIINTNNL